MNRSASSYEHDFSGPPGSRGWLCQLYLREARTPTGHFRSQIQEFQRTLSHPPHPSTGNDLLATLERLEDGQLAQVIDWMREDGFLEKILPELASCFGVTQNEHHAHDVGNHIVQAAQAHPPQPARRRLALLLHDLGKPQTRSRGDDGRIHFYGHHKVGANMVPRIGERLGLDDQQIRWLRDAVRWHMELMWVEHPQKDRKRLRKLAYKLADSPLELADLVALRVADKKGAGLKEKQISDRWKEEMNEILEEWKRQPPPLAPRDLAVSRQELAEYMNRPSDHPEVQKAHDRMLEKVIEQPARNTRSALLEPIQPHLPVDGHDVIRELGLDGGGPRVGEILDKLRQQQQEKGFTASREELLEQIRACRPPNRSGRSR